MAIATSSSHAPQPGKSNAGDDVDANESLISVIVPVAERPEPLAELYKEFAEPLRAERRPFEFVFVVTPGYRSAIQELRALVEEGEPIVALEMGQASAESTMLKAGVAQARGGVILTLPAYRRVEPSALIPLVAALEDGADLAVARRWPRRDGAFSRWQSRVFHLLLGGLAGHRLKDIASGVRAFRPTLLDNVPLYGDFARFLPILALRDGFRVEEIDAPQHPREVRRRVYAPGVYVRRLLDLLGLYFLTRFTEKPLRFFGLLGLTTCATGGVILIVLLAQRLQGQGLANRPLLVLGVLFIVLGVQAVALGLVGEIIVHLHASSRRTYRLARD